MVSRDLLRATITRENAILSAFYILFRSLTNVTKISFLNNVEGQTQTIDMFAVEKRVGFQFCHFLYVVVVKSNVVNWRIVLNIYCRQKIKMINSSMYNRSKNVEQIFVRYKFPSIKSMQGNAHRFTRICYHSNILPVQLQQKRRSIKNTPYHTIIMVVQSSILLFWTFLFSF